MHLLFCLSCLTSCMRVPVNKPVPPCTLPAVSAFPTMQVTDSVDKNYVTIPSNDIRNLYLWINEENDRLNKAEVCIANRE